MMTVLILAIATACAEEEKPACNIFATVRDLTGLDGCGFVFELDDGSRLEPVRVYRTLALFTQPPPYSPLEEFPLREGQRVRLAYRLEAAAGSICMVGPVVFVTCIEEFMDCG